MRKEVDKHNKNLADGWDIYHYYGFEICKIPFNQKLCSRYDTLCTRTYLEDGSFFSETMVSSIDSTNYSRGYEPFKGRATEECRFKVGDLVEVYDGEDTVSLEIVCALPPTPERVEQIYRKTREDYQRRGIEIEDELCWRLDNTDDSYVTLDGDEGYMENHSHPSAIRLFPVRSKVPTKLREKLERGLKKVQSE